MQEPNQCTICMSRIKVPTKTNGCPHTFCFKCIYKWASSGTNACPVCREYFSQIFKLSDRKPVKIEDREISDDSDHQEEQVDLLSGDICMLCGEQENKELENRVLVICDSCGVATVHPDCLGLQSAPQNWQCADCENHQDEDLFFILEDGTIVAVDFNYDEDDEEQQEPEIDLSDLTNEEKQDILNEHDRAREGPMTRSRLLRVAAVRRLQAHHENRNRARPVNEKEEEKKNIESDQKECRTSCSKAAVARQSCARPCDATPKRCYRGACGRREEPSKAEGANQEEEH